MKSKRMNKLIKGMIPFVSENFISFPLAEEGDYSLELNVWRIFENIETWEDFESRLIIPDDITIEVNLEELKDITREEILELLNIISDEKVYDIPEDLEIQGGGNKLLVSFGIGHNELAERPFDLGPLIEMAHKITDLNVQPIIKTKRDKIIESFERGMITYHEVCRQCDYLEENNACYYCEMLNDPFNRCIKNNFQFFTLR